MTLADVDTTVALSAGTHSVHYKAWSSGGLCMGSSSFTVAGGTTSAVDAGVDSGTPDSGSPDSGSSGSGYDGSKTIPEPPASASLYADLDDLTKWSAKTGAASQCPDGVASATCDPLNANYDTTVEHVRDPGSEPAGGNGEAGEFSLYDGPANATCIWGHSFATQPSARNFIWDFQIYVDATDYENSELDFYQILNGQRFMMGTQCDRANDSWDTWNENTQHWVKNTEIHCQEILTAGAWHRRRDVPFYGLGQQHVHVQDDPRGRRRLPAEPDPARQVLDLARRAHRRAGAARPPTRTARESTSTSRA